MYILIIFHTKIIVRFYHKAISILLNLRLAKGVIIACSGYRQDWLVRRGRRSNLEFDVKLTSFGMQLFHAACYLMPR